MRPRPGPGETSKAHRHLVIKLARGWRYLPRKKLLEGPEPANPVDPLESLPKGCHIEPMVPDLAEADPKKLSSSERNLARYLHLFFPARWKPESYVEQVCEWPAVEEARVPPEVSLP